MNKYMITVTKTTVEYWEVEADNTINASDLYEDGKAEKISEVVYDKYTEVESVNV